MPPRNLGLTKPDRVHTEEPSQGGLEPNSLWGKIELTMQRSDKAKIDNCKEDIDTLLVFAGLFSAVLSAFVIVSLQDLKEDQSKRSADTLQHMSIQLASYSVTKGFINSTVPPYIHTPFEPLHTAVLVNALWFSSLVLSLTTASFGMLIKGWLREYLAGDFVSPQARLRVRHFRFLGLETWMVYEIASALPLLLQVALGLFFYGLCVFTADAHRSVDWASFTLVMGWLLLFLFTIVAPIFSARCPYKTTLLKSLFSFIHENATLGCNHILLKAWHYDLIRNKPSLSPLREVDTIAVTEEDHQILLAVDRILLDNHFFTTAIWDTFDQLHLGPA